MTTYRVTAPMVLLKVRGLNGPQINNFYAGAIVPDSVAEVDGENLRRHLDRGWVEKVDELPAPPAVESRPDPDAVPEGTADEVKAWVGEDVERAKRALAAEQKLPSPRKTLVDQLAKLVTPAKTEK